MHIVTFPRLALCMLILLASTTTGFTQSSKIAKAKILWNAGSVYLGVHQTQLFNKTFNQLTADQTITLNPGFQTGFVVTTYPFVFDLGFFNSSYDIEEGFSSYLDSGDEDVSVSHSGGEASLSLMLFPQVPAIQPFVGAGYQYSSLGINLSGEEGNRSGIPMHTPVYKIGLALQIKKFGLNGQYKRSFTEDDQRKFYQLSLGITYQFAKNDY